MTRNTAIIVPCLQCNVHSNTFPDDLWTSIFCGYLLWRSIDVSSKSKF